MRIAAAAGKLGRKILVRQGTAEPARPGTPARLQVAARLLWAGSSRACAVGRRASRLLAVRAELAGSAASRQRYLSSGAGEKPTGGIDASKRYGDDPVAEFNEELEVKHPFLYPPQPEESRIGLGACGRAQSVVQQRGASLPHPLAPRV
jgi:hypothetical protein